jgi:hypothetical protein
MAKNGDDGNGSQDDPCPWLAPFRFKPGESGNTRGRPRATPITSNIAKWLVATHEVERIAGKKVKKRKLTGAEIMAETLIDLAMRGNATAIKEILERIEGKVPDEFMGELYHAGLDQEETDTAAAVKKLTPRQRRELGKVIMAEFRRVNGGGNGPRPAK